MMICDYCKKLKSHLFLDDKNNWCCDDCDTSFFIPSKNHAEIYGMKISKQDETDIWNEITTSIIDYDLKSKLLFRLRKNKFPKFKIQQNLDRYF